MLLPKRVKYRRVQRGRMKGKATRGNKVTYGDYGLQALEPAWITSQPDRGGPCRHDPLLQTFQVRSGSRFSPTSPSRRSRLKPEWVPVKAPRVLVAVVKPGRVMFELGGIPEATAKEALRLAANSSPSSANS